MTRNQINMKESDRMNPEVKALWLAALRSGEYTQGRNALKRHGDGPQAVQHCCLGVLCEVHHAQHPEESHWKPHKHDGVDIYAIAPYGADLRGVEKSSGSLPDPVRVWSGLYSGQPHRVMSELIGLNDSGAPFNVIADRIERDL